MRYIFGILVFILIFTSCGTMRNFKTSDFSAINDVKNLEGEYINLNSDRISILSRFNIREEANFVTITSENPNELRLIYYSDTSIRKEQIFVGEMKKNYFEIYFLKEQFFIPLLYSSCNIDRVRIGKTNDGKLLIRKFVDQSGNLLFFGAGYSVETPYIFSNANQFNDYTPVHENGLWGFSDQSEKIVIPKKYDFVSFFDKDVARVKFNNKWGLINRQGEEITPIKYDKLSLIDTVFSPPIIRAYIGGKVGILDLSGNETIPVIYDYVGYFNSYNPFVPSLRLTPIRLGDKWGYATRTGVVVPAIYSELRGINNGHYLVKRNEKTYMIDKDGYEYESRGSFGTWTPILETKRKVQLEEQKME